MISRSSNIDLKRVELTNDVNDLPPFWNREPCEGDKKWNEGVFPNFQLAQIVENLIKNDSFIDLSSNRYRSSPEQSENSSRKESRW